MQSHSSVLEIFPFSVVSVSCGSYRYIVIRNWLEIFSRSSSHTGDLHKSPLVPATGEGNSGVEHFILDPLALGLRGSDVPQSFCSCFLKLLMLCFYWTFMEIQDSEIIGINSDIWLRLD